MKIYDLIINSKGIPHPMKDGTFREIAAFTMSGVYDESKYILREGANGITYRVSVNDADKPEITKFFEGLNPRWKGKERR